MRHAKSNPLLKLTTTPTKEKKRSQLGPLLNAPVIAEWVEKVLPVKVLVLSILFCNSIGIGIGNSFWPKY